jgi:molybdenum cofactor cytidylyltransferase
MPAPKTYPEVRTAIILAAGQSSRMGQSKALLAYAGRKTFLEHLVETYLRARVRRIVVVVHRGIFKHIRSLLTPFRHKGRLSVLLNMHPETGRFTSIALGAGLLEKDDSAFIQNIDNPFTSAAVLEAMVPRLRPSSWVAPAVDGQKGHPVLLAPEILDAIRRTDPSGNLRDLLNGYPATVIQSDDTRILANINTPEDYQRYFSHETLHPKD